MTAAKQQKKPVEAKKETTASVASTVYKEAEFPVSELREHSRKVFGIKPEVFDGAFFNYEKASVSKKEAEKMIQGYLKKEVK